MWKKNNINHYCSELLDKNWVLVNFRWGSTTNFKSQNPGFKVYIYLLKLDVKKSSSLNVSIQVVVEIKWHMFLGNRKYNTWYHFLKYLLLGKRSAINFTYILLEPNNSPYKASTTALNSWHI